MVVQVFINANSTAICTCKFGWWVNQTYGEAVKVLGVCLVGTDYLRFVTGIFCRVKESVKFLY